MFQPQHISLHYLTVAPIGSVYFSSKSTISCPSVFKLHMADSEHSSSGKTNVHSSAFCSEEETSEESKLKFSEDEETLIIRMYNLVGERWALIAGRIPGRTAEEIEEYWNTRYSTSE